MSCDATATEELPVGDDWVWDWTTTDDVSDWSDPEIEVWSTPNTTGTMLFSNDGDGVVTSGGLAGAVPATNFASGVFTWFIAAADTADVSEPSVFVRAKAKVNGVETTVFPWRGYRVVT